LTKSIKEVTIKEEKDNDQKIYKAQIKREKEKRTNYITKLMQIKSKNTKENITKIIQRK
jgi:hypothetical protein